MRRINQPGGVETGREAQEGMNFQQVGALFSFKQRWLELNSRKKSQERDCDGTARRFGRSALTAPSALAAKHQL
jgi:hypothetical protein